jgi:predicted transcriptional regulator
MSKRPDGSLETDVLNALWNAGRPLQPTEVRGLVPGDLAYTSIATILTRLHAKGHVTRTAVGRAFEYAPIVGESELAAKRISGVLAGASNREAALASLVSTLAPDDRDALRRLLDGLTQ